MAGGDGKIANDTKANAVPVQYQFAQKPVIKPGWEGVKEFLWNSETSEFLGRTGCSWLKICLFYLIYYACLTGFFMVMLFVFYQTLDDEVPKWTNENSIIGTNPGVGFRPRPPDDFIDSTLVSFRHGERVGNYDNWVKDLDYFLEDYNKKPSPSKPNAEVVQCSFTIPPGAGQICKVDIDEVMQSPCNPDSKYGFKDGKPCILLKLNRIYGWLPEPYKNSSDLPEEAPKTLRSHMQEVEAAGSGKENMMGHVIWFSCEGENPADIENLGVIKYYPFPGIADYYFPYKNQKDYLSPIVFAYLENPRKGVLISVECKAWAKNIKRNSADRIGSVHFEVMID